MNHGYPRPQFRRKEWTNLNGIWEFSLDREAAWNMPQDVKWTQQIVVPYSPETPLSGVHETGYFLRCWYRRQFTVHPLPNERVMVHFGAVDYSATVWVNGRMAVTHEGGYTPFSADITNLIDPSAPNEIIVRADDNPHGLDQPRGKQDWLLEPHSIWYPRTSGIWQTVWIEKLPSTSIGKPKWTPNLEFWQISMEERLEGQIRAGLRLGVKMYIGNLLLAHDTYEVIAGEVTRRIGLSDPGIDDYRNELLWSPRSPTLITVELELSEHSGELLDKAWSYTALRSFSIQGDRLLLNGRPYPLRLVLDQGYWPESGLTAPEDGALRRDVELAKQMGFNGVRKHQKLEDPRYLYWADRLGLLVWEEMPSAYRFTSTSVERVNREWIEIIDRDYSHPCIIAWVPFNESWGVPNLPEVSSQRYYVQGMYYLTKTLDPTRPVLGNDGWESVATDIVGIHDYDSAGKIAERYIGDERIPHLFKRERPGGRLLTVEGHEHSGQPIVLSEFGGIGLTEDPSSWSYSHAATPEEFLQRYAELLKVVRSLSMLAGFCYTQFADTYQEKNGLLFADRTSKAPLKDIYRATLGQLSVREEAIHREWKTRMQRFKRDMNVSDDPYLEDEEKEHE